MRYKPWLGLTMIALSIVAEFILPGRFHRTGRIFFVTLVCVWVWSVYHA